MRTPNPEQAHASIATTGTASTLVEIGYSFDNESQTLLVQCVGGVVRMTINGTTPTASLGIQIADGVAIELTREEALVAKFITGSGSPKLEIAAYLE